MNASAATRLAKRLLKEQGLLGWTALCRQMLESRIDLDGRGRPVLALPNQIILLSPSAFRDFSADEARRVILDEIAQWKKNHKPN